MSESSHRAKWTRFQNALLRMVDDPQRCRYLINSQRHRDAVEVLGRGTEEELLYEMWLWEMDFPELFVRAL